MAWRCGPALKATNSTLGMGNLPSVAVWVAAIMPKVSAGKTISAKALPMKGTMDTTETVAMNKKNRPDRASG